MEAQLLLLFGAVISASHTRVLNFYLLVDDDFDEPLHLSWSEASNECRSGYTDMLTLDIMSQSTLRNVTEGLSVVWMGLQRDAHNDSVWHWLDTKIVDPTSGDFSMTLNWFDNGNSTHCAYYNTNDNWYSRKCAEKHPFFCSTTQGIFYHKTNLSWHEARKVCQDNDGGDLPTITKHEANGNGYFRSGIGVFGWIGLYRVGGDKWMWAKGEEAQYTGWADNEPVTNDCGAFDALEQKWQSFPCNTLLNVMCFVDKLTVVHERKTWEEALEHCRSLNEQCTVKNDKKKCTLQHDLVMLNGQFDYSHVRERINNATDEVWTGLRFLGGQWWWMNGEPVTVIEGLPHCPDHLSSCGAFSKTTGRISFTDCSKKLHFICQKARE